VTTNGWNKIREKSHNKYGLLVYVDPASEMFLLGTTIDYIKEDYSKGQFENKFIFEVDKELLSTCGCGTSFTPK
jgi:Fe-S cluster assembly iron-binding protein IscA